MKDNTVAKIAKEKLMTENSDNVWLVWKQSKTRTNASEFHEKGIYPTGELMGICPTEEDADRLINYLEEFSPSSRFGTSENPRDNDMEDAPYFFSKTNREMSEF